MSDETKIRELAAELSRLTQAALGDESTVLEARMIDHQSRTFADGYWEVLPAERWREIDAGTHKWLPTCTVDRGSDHCESARAHSGDIARLIASLLTHAPEIVRALERQAPTPQPPAQVDVRELRSCAAILNAEAHDDASAVVRAAAADLAAAQSHARDYDALVDTLAAERKLRVEAEAARASAWEAEKAAVWQVENATAHLQRLIPAEPNMSLNLGMLCCQVDHSLAAAREECERLKSAKHWQDAIAERARLIADLNRYHVANVKLLSAKDAAVAELADIDKVLDESFVRPHRLRRDTMIGNLIDGLNSNHEENVKLETALAHERAIVAQLKEALRGCECANCKSVSASRAQQGGE